jgi:hypothetical protein
MADLGPVNGSTLEQQRPAYDHVRRQNISRQML